MHVCLCPSFERVIGTMEQLSKNTKRPLARAEGLKINKLTISFENEENNDPAAIIITPKRYIFFLPTLSEILPIGNKTATTVIVDTREIQAAEDKSKEKSLEIFGSAIPIILASITAVKRPNAMDIKESHFCFWVILIFLIIICSQVESLGKVLQCYQI